MSLLAETEPETLFPKNKLAEARFSCPSSDGFSAGLFQPTSTIMSPRLQDFAVK
jgi:hypothetical protein